MRYFRQAALTAALALACLSTSAAAGTISLQPLYDGQCSDIIQGRWSNFTQTLTPDYVGLGLDGGPPANHANQYKGLHDLVALMGANDCSVRIAKTTQDGKVATATLYFTLTGILPAPTHGMNKGDHVAITFHSFDIWRITGATPVQAADVTLGLIVTRNGEHFLEQGQN